MADNFMASLIQSSQAAPSKVTAKTVNAKVESSVEATRWIDGEKKKEVTEVKSEKAEVETKFFREKTMYMSYDLGATLNLGNFNMGKVNVSISMPVGTEITPELVQKLNTSFEFMKKYTETKMEQEVKELIKMRDL